MQFFRLWSLIYLFFSSFRNHLTNVTSIKVHTRSTHLWLKFLHIVSYSNSFISTPNIPSDFSKTVPEHLWTITHNVWGSTITMSPTSQYSFWIINSLERLICPWNGIKLNSWVWCWFFLEQSLGSSWGRVVSEVKTQVVGNGISQSIWIAWGKTNSWSSWVIFYENAVKTWT